MKTRKLTRSLLLSQSNRAREDGEDGLIPEAKKYFGRGSCWWGEERTYEVPLMINTSARETEAQEPDFRSDVTVPLLRAQSAGEGPTRFG